MRHHEFNINDPFQRQRRKRSGINNDLAKIYQQDVDKPMIARIVEAARRPRRQQGEIAEVRIEEKPS